MNFVKKIFIGDVDEKTHIKFIKFGKGNYKKVFPLSLWQTNKVKIKTSFDFANDLALFCSDLGSMKVSGIVLSKKDISNVISANNIKGDSESKKSGLYYKNNILEQELNKNQIVELEKVSYSFLLDIKGDGFELKVKKKPPRPGKSEGKIDNKFCQLELNERYGEKIREDLFWDMPNAKKIVISHEVIVDEIVFPEGEKDYSKIREIAKRKGKIIRNAIIDGKDITSEKELLV